MNVRPLIAALVALTSTGCGVPVAELGDATDQSGQLDDLKAAKAPAPTATYKVRLASTQTNPTFKTSFVIATTPDVFAAFDIPSKLAGSHTAAFEFLSPDGVVFQRTEVPFSMGTAKTYRVWNAMPVSGTWIQQFAMTGTWQVKVYLDAEAISRATATFVLQ